MRAMKTLKSLIAASALIVPIATAPAAHAAPTTTRYAQSWRTQYLFTATSNGKTVGALHGGEAVTGDAYAHGWFKITAGPNAGLWIWGASPTPTPKPTRTNVTYYTGTAVPAQGYLQAKTSSAKKNTLAPVTAVTGDMYANGWFQQRSGAYTYFTNVMNGNPYTPFETRQWNNTTGYHAMAPTSQTVKRYATLNKANVPVRAQTSLTSTIVARLKPGTAVTGRYMNSHWFKVTSGAQAGRYISTGVLFTSPNQSAYNGRLKDIDLCTVPTPMRLTMDKYDRSMNCEAVQELAKLDTKLKSTTGTGVRQWDAYRTYQTSVKYMKMWGAAIVAQAGTSNHGLGLAIDMRYDTKKSLAWSSPTVVNFTKYGKAYGWVKPTYIMKTTRSNGEPWHFEFNG